MEVAIHQFSLLVSPKGITFVILDPDFDSTLISLSLNRKLGSVQENCISVGPAATYIRLEPGVGRVLGASGGVRTANHCSFSGIVARTDPALFASTARPTTLPLV